MPRAILAALLVTFICAVPSAARVGSGKIAFVKNDGLYTVNPDGTGRTLLKADWNLDPGYHFSSPRWSPDGSRLAFVDFRGGGDWRLMVMNADGSNEHLVAVAASMGLSRQPWSPDSARLAWGPGTNSAGDVYTADASGGDVRRLTFRGDVRSSPSWSSTGSTLVYSTGAGLFVIGADGSGERQITPQGSFEPTWSPSGEWIAFIGDRGVTLVRPDGSDLHAVASVVGTYYRLTWSPDGSTIAFGVRHLPGRAGPVRGEVYVVDANGSNLKRLNTDGWGFAPVWSPDGGRLLLTDARRAPSTQFVTMNPDGKCAMNVTSGFLLGDSSWQAIPNGPPAGPARCHAIAAGGTVAEEWTAVVVGATVVNEGTDPLTKVTLEISAPDAVSPAAASRGCTVRRGGVTCRLRRLAPGDSHDFAVRLEVRRVRSTGRTIKVPARIKADASEELLLSGREKTSLTLFMRRCTVRDRGGGTIRGTRSADRICGRRGADRIDPGPGNDVVQSGGGNDVVVAADGRRFRDQIRCGRGQDSVVADRRDFVESDCERVLRQPR